MYIGGGYGADSPFGDNGVINRINKSTHKLFVQPLPFNSYSFTTSYGSKGKWFFEFNVDGEGHATSLKALDNNYSDIGNVALSGNKLTIQDSSLSSAMGFSSDTISLHNIINKIGTDFARKSEIPADELPAIASGDAGKVLAVNTGETGVEWVTPSSGGTQYYAGTGVMLDSSTNTFSIDESWLTAFVQNIIGGGGEYDITSWSLYEYDVQQSSYGRLIVSDTNRHGPYNWVDNHPQYELEIATAETPLFDPTLTYALHVSIPNGGFDVIGTLTPVTESGQITSYTFTPAQQDTGMIQVDSIYPQYGEGVDPYSAIWTFTIVAISPGPGPGGAPSLSELHIASLDGQTSYIDTYPACAPYSDTGSVAYYTFNTSYNNALSDQSQYEISFTMSDGSYGGFTGTLTWDSTNNWFEVSGYSDPIDPGSFHIYDYTQSQSEYGIELGYVYNSGPSYSSIDLSLATTAQDAVPIDHDATYAITMPSMTDFTIYNNSTNTEVGWAYASGGDPRVVDGTYFECGSADGYMTIYARSGCAGNVYRIEYEDAGQSTTGIVYVSVNN